MPAEVEEQEDPAVEAAMFAQVFTEVLLASFPRDSERRRRHHVAATHMASGAAGTILAGLDAVRASAARGEPRDTGSPNLFACSPASRGNARKHCRRTLSTTFWTPASPSRSVPTPGCWSGSRTSTPFGRRKPPGSMPTKPYVAARLPRRCGGWPPATNGGSRAGMCNPGFRATGEHFGVSRETVRQAVRRWESYTGQALDRAPTRRRKAREQAALAKRLLTPPSLAQRLLARAHLNEETGCWDWDGPLHTQDGKSYPAFRALGEQFAHRVSHVLWVGPIPKTHLVRRTCRRFRCIAPFHLRAISRIDAARSWALGARRPLATHCKRGHEFTPENIIWNPVTTIQDGERITKRYRVCRTCVQGRLRACPPRPRPKRPPLPTDWDERQIELSIRRIETAAVARRADVLVRELESTLGTVCTIKRPALPDESLEDYHTRTGGRYAEWFTSRVTDTPRKRSRPPNPVRILPPTSTRGPPIRAARPARPRARASAVRVAHRLGRAGHLP